MSGKKAYRKNALCRKKRGLGLRFEPLEDRRVLATLTVLNVSDSGAGSLRDAIAQANASAGTDTICFSDDLNGADIDLTTGALFITEDLIIDADSLSSGITIDASASDLTPSFNDGNGSRVFVVDDGVVANQLDVEMRNLTVTGGDFFGNGGAIWNAESLEMYDSTISGSFATANGGGIATIGPLLLDDSTVTQNESGENGGGIATDAPDELVRIVESTVSLNTAGAEGGGIFVRLTGDTTPGTVEIEDSTIRSNSAGQNGGGICITNTTGGTVTIEDTLISSNDAQRHGGGIYASLTDATVTIGDSTISGNDSGEDGGGIALPLTESTIEITDSTLSTNEAGNNGGGIAVGSDATIERVLVTDNMAAGQGGGVHVFELDDNDFTLLHATISGNNALDGGAVAFEGVEDSEVTIDSSTFSGNSASRYGGGVYAQLDDGVTNLIQVTISGNSAGDDGGGVFAISEQGGSDAQLNIDFATVVENSSVGSGADGISVVNEATAAIDFDLRWSIVAGNGDVDVEAANIDAEMNLIESPDADLFGGSVGNNIVGIDPLIESLRDNGGLVETHALEEGSPAIDFGTASSVTLPSNDARGDGFSRFVNGDGLNGAESDLGAFEAEEGEASNTGPLADAGDDAAVRVGENARLDGSGSSDDGIPQALTYSWMQVSGPVDGTFTATDLSIVNFSASMPGEYVIELTVSDGELSSTDQVIVTIAENTAPVANVDLSDTTGIIFSAVTLDGSLSSDPEGDDLTYSWTLIDIPSRSDATIDSPRSEITSFTPDIVGTFVAQLVVNDGLLSSDPVTVTINVTNGGGGGGGNGGVWHNTANPTDVDGNGVISPLDALLVINELTFREYSDTTSGELNDTTVRPDDAGQLDVDDNGFISPVDALLVINELPSDTPAARGVPATGISTDSEPVRSVAVVDQAFATLEEDEDDVEETRNTAPAISF